MIRGKNMYKVLLTAYILALGSLFVPHSVFAAASLYFSPAGGTYKIGQSFSVVIYVSSPSQSSNAYSGNISFDQSILTLNSISKSGSIITIWARDPSFSNSSGSISFEGIVPNPGYTGSAGRLLTLSFTAQTAGDAAVRFVAGSVLANDGQGTNIVSGLGTATFTIQSTDAQNATAPPDNTQVADGLPPLPKVSSSTHPDPNSWYADPNPRFSWIKPRGVTGVNIFGDQNPDTDPGTISDGNISKYSYNNVADGVWYFHIKYKNARGWGPTAHFKFQIDTVKPTLQASGVDSGSATAKLTIKGADSGSGINHYEISIDGADPIKWIQTADETFETKYLGPGVHNFSVKAIDMAGNEITQLLNVPIALASTKTVAKSGIPLRNTLKYLLIGLLALLLLTVLARILKKVFVLLPFAWALIRNSQSTRLKTVAMESIEILEKASAHRALTHEEERILRNLRKALYGGATAARVQRSTDRIINGVFDGRNMAGSDGKTYEVPANYSSKSKMIEGDKLRLIIKEDGGHVYKQVGPVERQKKHGVLGEQNDGEIRVIADGRAYKVSPATLLFHNAEPGDEVEVIVPKDGDAEWAALQRVTKKKPKEETPLKRYKRRTKKSE